MNNTQTRTNEKENSDEYKLKLIDYLRDYTVIQLKRYCYQNEDSKVMIVEAIYLRVKKLIVDGNITNFSRIEDVVTKVIEKNKELIEHEDIEEDLAVLYMVNKASNVKNLFDS